MTVKEFLSWLIKQVFQDPPVPTPTPTLTNTNTNTNTGFRFQNRTRRDCQDHQRVQG